MPQAPPEEREREALDFIERVTSSTDEVQKRVLSEILEMNGNSEYLQMCCLHGRTDRESFKRTVPIVTYENIEPFIKRIANGDKSPILSAKPISEFLTSSGTSAGERKLMPTIEDEFQRKSLLYSLLMPVMKQYVPGLDQGRGMYFLFIKAEAKTPGGLVARPVLTSYYKSRWFQEKAYDPCSVCTSPTEAILCLDSYQSMYCQLLCGLIQRSQVVRVGAVFASGFLRAIKFLEEHWTQLCHDIRTGHLSDCVTDDSLRNVVCSAEFLSHPQPDLASTIESECQKQSWQGIINRLWPRSKYVDVIVTGTMAQYIPTLDFYSGGLPLVSTMYASSECYFGLNLQPWCKPWEVRYTIMPNMGYFEFLPVDRYSSPHNNNSDTESVRILDLADLKVGQEYELVVTTYAGLYRYKVGDILRVTGYYNQAPQFEFVCRKNVVLSIDSEKTDEESLHKASKTATNKHLEPHKARLVEYTSYADCCSLPGHYILYWELRSDQLDSSSATPLSSDVFESCCLTVEEGLDSVYRQNRASGSIGPLEIRIVKHGTFDQLMDYCLNRGASINQYKTPRCVSAPGMLQLLDSRVTESYYSPKCPFWSPIRPQWAST